MRKKVKITLLTERKRKKIREALGIKEEKEYKEYLLEKINEDPIYEITLKRLYPDYYREKVKILKNA